MAVICLHFVHWVNIAYHMITGCDYTHPHSEFTRLIIYKFFLRNKPNLHVIISFAYQGEQLNEIHSVV